MYYLLTTCEKTEADGEELKKNSRSPGKFCRENLKFILANLHFNLTSTFDYVLALLMAVSWQRISGLLLLIRSSLHVVWRSVGCPYPGTTSPQPLKYVSR